MQWQHVSMRRSPAVYVRALWFPRVVHACDARSGVHRDCCDGETCSMPSPSESGEDYGVLSKAACQPDAEICGAVSEAKRVIGYGVAIGPDGNPVRVAHRMHAHHVGIHGYHDAASGGIEVNRNRLSLHDS